MRIGIFTHGYHWGMQTSPFCQDETISNFHSSIIGYFVQLFCYVLLFKNI